ncbi:MAG: hypothetical protein M1825_003236 [Sarcosagium campestre]|nr:MAG: hypothetical protein M1825_003236 [Sarcosagium campestre]
MAPNLFLLTRKAVSPHRWFCSTERPEASSQNCRRTEHWDLPVPGTYEYIPGRGWYLIARDTDDNASEKHTLQREHVHWCPIVQRWMLQSELRDRTRWVTAAIGDSSSNGGGGGDNESGRHQRASRTKTTTQIRVFRLDDGLTWLQCWENDGRFKQGPYQRWCLDKESGLFRKMLVDDRPPQTADGASRG